MKEQGVSLVEMISVLLIMAIVAGVIISRVAGLDDLELAAKVNSIRNHIRYTQIMAMKRNDMTWGIRCDGTHYWVFKTNPPAPPTTTWDDVSKDTNNMVYLPGNQDKQISITEMDAFALYFDRFGIPYIYNGTDLESHPATGIPPINIGSKHLTVTEETGFVE